MKMIKGSEYFYYLFLYRAINMERKNIFVQNLERKIPKILVTVWKKELERDEGVKIGQKRAD